MTLTLITGPANAAKAGAVLERLRAALPREPVLVVPTSADAVHYSRELAGAGIVFGAEVTTFPRLMRDLARGAGVRGRPLGRVARERVVRAAIRDVPLRALADSSAGPGFASALGDLFAELQRSLAGPARFGAAARAWREAGTAPPHAGELAALYSAYHRRLEALGAVDADGLVHAALDAARERWSGRPLFLYGFDELLPAQLDLVETLVRHTDTEVCVALTYEAGRAALAGSATTVELLKPLAREHIALEPRSEHYAPSARRALHTLERGLFEAEPARVPPNGAVRLLEAGGERAEAELVAASVLELLRDGMAHEDVAVLVRGRPAADLFAQVFETYGLPVARDRRTPFAQTRLGAGVLAFARAALPGGTAQDVVTWLRTPGKLAAAARNGDGPETDLADRLEVQVRRHEARNARDARWHWAQLGGRDLVELDELAAADGTEAFLALLLAEAERVWTAPHTRCADVLDPSGEDDARAARELRAAIGELMRLAEADAELAGDRRELLEALAAVEVREGEPAAEGAPGVLLADPLAIRARRFRAVLACGLQEGELPRRPVPEPFLDDGARASLAVASGLVLPRHEDTLPRERSLFYACVSRPEEALFLSFRSSDEEGDPQQPSPFLDDVRALFTEELWSGRGRRLLAEVTWPPAEAPTPHELRRAQAAGEERPAPAPLGSPQDPDVLRLLAARDRESARGLEAFAGCPVKWLIEHVLRPGPVDPDPEAMRRGSLGHAVLERTLRGLKARTGSARLTPDTLREALAELATAIGELSAAARTAPAKAAARALEVDLERYIRHEAATGAGYEPGELEWSFDALMIDGVAVSGRVDRIDRDGRRAIVRDYKGRTVYAGARWAEDGRIQAALYAIAVREQLGLDVVGALYQPIGSADQRPRGFVRDDVPGRYVNGDVVDGETLAARLEESRAVAAQAAADLRAGRIRPCPDRCAYNGGCAHPGICRS
ncbi:MAG TPA: PD-(D/E)XK nuclease family protein [Solirubrobacter sp.]|nr:PD-(D/E)XK nuclease family protein [Solirubrobacter sp.]